MLKRIASGTIASLLLIAMIGAKCSGNVITDARTITVPSSGYETIQEAINAANPSDIINVKVGIYPENLIVNKTVSIIGENPATTIIDGGGLGSVITITSPTVVISGFTIKNGKEEEWPYCGILIYRCNFAIINNNTLRDNYYGLHLLRSNSNKIFNNAIVNNSYAGIRVADSSSNNVFSGNRIMNNFVYGLWITNAPSNTFYHNNLIDNTKQLWIDSSATWDNGVEGNFWSDYVGADVDMDGVGDSEYTFAGDKHPLMGMFTNFTVQYKSQRYFLSTISNSTISNFRFDESQKKISFDVVGQNGTIGFCRIAMLATFVEDLWQGNYTVLVDGNTTAYIGHWASSAYNYSYLTYGHTGTAHKVTMGPGFQGDNLFLLIIAAALSSMAILAVVILTLRRRKKFQVKS
ncbi:MAG: right-handed parallel beta-helix repeat-containing protein [Candidatus Bathyarchaeota archaeon]|nr:right-handed parallel beta-helix repeat-containing protein [Candidatus Bathyarchaeota archaeon]